MLATSDVIAFASTADLARARTSDEAVLGLPVVVFTRYEGVAQDAQGVWTNPNGDRIAWFSDPDGNVLSLTEFT